MNFTDMFYLYQCANLQGVKMLCSNAEGASLKGCNFEDPSGLKANLEGKTFLPVGYSVEAEPLVCKSVWLVRRLAVFVQSMFL